MTLRLTALRHVYRSPAGDERPVLAIDHLELAAGSQALLRGVSGSGKTTLFNIVAGLLHPTAGQVAIADQDLYALGEAARDRFRARRIGYVFQNHHLLPHLTAHENVVMPLAFARALPRRAWAARADELLAAVGLAGEARYRPPQLSTGQRLRVAVARALANQPAVLLADEPTAALDADSAEQVMAFIQRTCAENHALLVVASHDPALSQRFPCTLHLRAGSLFHEAQPA